MLPVFGLEPERDTGEGDRDSEQDPVRSEVRAQQPNSNAEDQRTAGDQQRNHNEICPGWSEPSPPSSPRVDDKPEQQSERQEDQAVDAQEVAKATHHGEKAITVDRE